MSFYRIFLIPLLLIMLASDQEITEKMPASAAPLVGWPVRRRITQPFGCTSFYSGIPAPYCPADAPWFHDGLDLAAWPGEPIRAAITGTVIFAGPDGDGPACGVNRGYGLGVVIDNGQGWQTLYAHLSHIAVTRGQKVTPNTLIGAAGATGCVSGPHLHFGVRHQGVLIDPMWALAHQAEARGSSGTGNKFAPLHHKEGNR